MHLVNVHQLKKNTKMF